MGQDVLPGAMAAPSYVHSGQGAQTQHEPALSEIYAPYLPTAADLYVSYVTGLRQIEHIYIQVNVCCQTTRFLA